MQAAFTVSFGFFAVEAVGHIGVMMISQCHSCCCGNRNTFVRRAKQYIEFNACIDCHEFFKVSSHLQGRKIMLRQPRMTHTFTDGNCSCNDRWSWEARLTPKTQAAAATKPTKGAPNPGTALTYCAVKKSFF